MNDLNIFLKEMVTEITRVNGHSAIALERYGTPLYVAWYVNSDSSMLNIYTTDNKLYLLGAQLRLCRNADTSKKKPRLTFDNLDVVECNHGDIQVRKLRPGEEIVLRDGYKDYKKLKKEAADANLPRS